MAEKYDYDLIVLGSGPAGQRAAIQAAKLQKKVLVVEKTRIGGSCLHQGTIPSKTLREAAITSSQNGISALQPVMDRKNGIVRAEAEVITQQLKRNSVEFLEGTGAFVSDHEISISGRKPFSSQHIFIATGTRPIRPPHIPFNDSLVFDTDSILEMKTLPRNLVILGAGVIGCEYASIFGELGVEVTLLDRRTTLLRSVDAEITGLLQKRFLERNISLIMGCELGKVTTTHSTVTVEINKKSQSFGGALYCMGREGNTDELCLEKPGIAKDKCGFIQVNRFYQTEKPHIYAVGDVIGAPALAASSSEQGRLASIHAFTGEEGVFPESFPYGIYTIPEISSVGRHEEELKEKKIPYVTGIAKYNELARGKILNDETGLLKLLIDTKSRKILGVHIIGTQATELIHIGQVAMTLGAGVDFFVGNVFNYPTLAEAYKVAAYHAYNQLRSKN